MDSRLGSCHWYLCRVDRQCLSTRPAATSGQVFFYAAYPVEVVAGSLHLIKVGVLGDPKAPAVNTR
jgi:hypothetical protein